MDYMVFPSISLPISCLVMGSVEFFIKEQEPSHRLLDAWVEAGGNIVDTGRNYAGGDSERVIGTWLKSRGIRDQFIVLTKGCHPLGPLGERRVTKEALESDISQSLSALQTDHIDIFLMHRDDESVPVGDIIGWLNEHKEAGRIQALGVSNWTRGRVEQANAFAQRNHMNGFELVSNYAGLATTNEPMWRECIEMDEDYRNWHIDTQIPNLCWSSLSHGFFSGKQDLAPQVRAEIVRTYHNDANWGRLQRATEFGHSRNLSPTQIACAYVLSQKYPSLAVAAAGNCEELLELVEASGVTLSDDEIDWLEGTS